MWRTGVISSLLVLSLADAASSHGTGLMGYGQSWYDPTCAYSCRAVIASAPLDCADLDMDHGGGMAMDMQGPSAMARCLGDGVATSKLESYWADMATGDPTVAPRWTYGATLANVTMAPNRTFEKGDTLNYTAAISDVDYEYQYSFNRFFDWEERIQSTYVIIIISVGVATPVALSAMGHLPLLSSIVDRLKPYLVYPATVGGYCTQPLPYMLGHAPSSGQGLWVAMFVVLNIVLGAITYHNFDQPHPWGFTRTGEMLAYVGYRTGHMAFALLPLTLLFSSRNNVLLWLTDWPFSTFLVLHRWVARLCVAHAVVHSITLLAAYAELGTYYADVHKPYWVWGIVATLCLVLLLFQSAAWLRRSSYEVFLLLHILLAVFAIAGCWYHVYYWKGLTGVYELWLYMTCAVWFFDRMLRVLWIAQNGVLRATVTNVSADTVRVDIPGVRWPPVPGRHAYVYFPTLHPLRAWENHPFSIIPTAMLQSNQSAAGSDQEKEELPLTLTSGPEGGTKGNSVSIYVKRHAGITSLLRECAAGLPVLLEGPYRGSRASELLKCDRVLLIGGGIGVTGLVSWAQAHPNVKLAWGLGEAAAPLARSLAVALGGIADKEVRVGGARLDVVALLDQEAQAGWERVGVLVCGPAGLCDAVRAAVVSVGRREKTVFELHVDAFTW
ncbi:hypothetical protein PG996_008914 [Apiospora saccharicola]|uniref:FAD-binding FR-type domain-containing protein n=1 Tax=Apiospora saccharicola TaxID=335842 RepID=A0ABR1UZB1_9PEZI